MKNILKANFIAIMLAGCASSGQHSIVADQDVTIIRNDGTSQNIKAGQEIPSSLEPLLIAAPGYVPILLNPYSGKDGKNFAIKMFAYQDWGGAEYDKKISQSLNQSYGAMIQVLELLSKRDYNQANLKSADLVQKMPLIAEVNFLHASTCIMAGKPNDALKFVTEGLRLDPQNLRGLDLLKSIKNSGGNGS